MPCSVIWSPQVGPISLTDTSSGSQSAQLRPVRRRSGRSSRARCTGLDPDIARPGVVLDHLDPDVGLGDGVAGLGHRDARRHLDLVDAATVEVDAEVEPRRTGSARHRSPTRHRPTAARRRHDRRKSMRGLVVEDVAQRHDAPPWRIPMRAAGLACTAGRRAIQPRAGRMNTTETTRSSRWPDRGRTRNPCTAPTVSK